jgi:TRAP-type C4-dicarboxylate transport system substrate-binding protein
MCSARRISAAGALLLLALTGCGGAAVDKAGGGGGVRTLELGTPDPPGRAGSAAAQHFADEVRRRSAGRLRIKIIFEADVKAVGGNKPAFDQTVARLVRDGHLPLGLIPARAWDTFGVTSLQALQAPFLVTTNDLTATILRGPLVADMLAGLQRAGVVGLTLLPDGLRHPVGLRGPLRGPDDYRGIRIRVPHSRASEMLMRALGARPMDLNGEGFANAVAAGRVTAAESSLELAGTLPAGVWISTNVTPYPKVDTLVADREAFAGLRGDERAVLRDAAASTLGAALKHGLGDSAAAAAACAHGDRLVNVKPAELAALEKAAQPVYGELERDPATRRFITEIKALKARTPVANVPGPACAGGGAPNPGAPQATELDGDPSVINGVYRYRLDEAAMIRSGVDPGDAHRNYGLQTVTLRDGTFRSATTENVTGDSACTGHYEVAGDQAEFTVTSHGCSGHWRFRWTKTRSGLLVTDVRSLPPDDGPDGRALDRVLWGSKPWSLIEKIPAAG